MHSDMTDIQALVCPENDMSRNNCIVEDCMQEEQARAYSFDKAEDE